MIKKDSKFCGSTKVGSRGQIVIPLELRKKLNIEEGEILFVVENSSSIEIMKTYLVEKAIKKIKK